MRWIDPLTNPDELTEVVQFLGYENSSDMLVDMLTGDIESSEHAGQLEGDITQLSFYLNYLLDNYQKTAAATAADILRDNEVNGIPIFNFKDDSLQSIIDAVIGVLNGKSVSNNGHARSRSPSRKITGYSFAGTNAKVTSFSQLLTCVVDDLQEMYPDDAVDKLSAVNGAISNDKDLLNPNGVLKQVGNLWVNTKQSSAQNEILALKCLNAFGHKPNELEIIS